ncbi:NAD(P)/FAD-dependent oxidoreductase [Pelagibacterium montanilacus]|uniref:NAD(P)/FAD-dependent oxidoreductase n=1 Tax=Pelagibacterium montanilacus TaxID=2185280 RepID=UPI001FE93DB6|nr:FAD-dependent oxidoreductase [Pelagibacterium montanilacus]
MAPHSIAVIGSGISGLAAAWHLSKTSRVTLIEREERIGGHTNTVAMDTSQGPVPVDTGFIVFNEANYPNLTAMFDHLKVATAPSHMGFAVSVGEGRLEYNGEKLVGMFGQKRNLLRPEHWRLVQDIVRFFRNAERDILDMPADITVAGFLERCGYSEAFIEDHILPVSAAIWSTPSRGMLDFPAHTFVRFFSNHGLLRILGRPSWRTVMGGAQEYVSRLLADAKMDVRTGVEITAIHRKPSGVEITDSTGQVQRFDEVVLACHADEARRMLADASPDEADLLGRFRFSTNHAVLHSDPAFMPKRRHLWCAWNYLRPAGNDDDALSVSYWMNRLQPLETRQNVFVTLNPYKDFAPGSIHYETDYRHPIFDSASVDAQSRIGRIQGVNRTWFAGAWLSYGFHEDGLQAGLEVAERIGGLDRPWTVERARDRIAHNWIEGESAKWAAE